MIAATALLKRLKANWASCRRAEDTELSASAITQVEFGSKLQRARVAAGLSPELVVKDLELTAKDIQAVEAGTRKVSTLEFERFCKAYNLEVDTFFDAEDPQTGLISSAQRSTDRSGASRARHAISKTFQIYYALGNLERLLKVERPKAPHRRCQAPRNWREAFRQGGDAAKAERQRLGLGSGPIRNFIEQIEGEGVVVVGARLHPDLAGIMLAQRDRFPMIVVNDDDHPWRRAFSIAHEYGHVLFDRFEHPGLVSLVEAAKDDLMEIRANAFAAEFLVPGDALHEVFGEPALCRWRLRRTPARRPIEMQEISKLADRFGVSYEVVLRQLKRKGYIDEAIFAEMSATLEVGVRKPVLHRAERAETKRRYLERCEEAYLRPVISRGKFVEVCSLVIDPKEAEARAVVLANAMQAQH